MPLIHRLIESSGPSAVNSSAEGAVGLFAMYLGYDLISKGCAVLRAGMENLRVEVKEATVVRDRAELRTHISQPK